MKKIFLIIFLLGCVDEQATASINNTECSISPEIYLEFRDWILRLEIDYSDSVRFNEIRQKYSVYMETSDDFTEGDWFEPFVIIERHRRIEETIDKVTEFSVESCRVKQNGISEYFYKVVPNNGEYTRLGINYMPNGKIESISYEDKSVQQKIDKGRSYIKLPITIKASD